MRRAQISRSPIRVPRGRKRPRGTLFIYDPMLQIKMTSVFGQDIRRHKMGAGAIDFFEVIWMSTSRSAAWLLPIFTGHRATDGKICPTARIFSTTKQQNSPTGGEISATPPRFGSAGQETPMAGRSRFPTKSQKRPTRREKGQEKPQEGAPSVGYPPTGGEISPTAPYPRCFCLREGGVTLVRAKIAIPSPAVLGEPSPAIQQAAPTAARPKIKKGAAGKKPPKAAASDPHLSSAGASATKQAHPLSHDNLGASATKQALPLSQANLGASPAAFFLALAGHCERYVRAPLFAAARAAYESDPDPKKRFHFQPFEYIFEIVAVDAPTAATAAPTSTPADPQKPPVDSQKTPVAPTNTLADSQKTPAAPTSTPADPQKTPAAPRQFRLRAHLWRGRETLARHEETLSLEAIDGGVYFCPPPRTAPRRGKKSKKAPQAQ